MIPVLTGILMSALAGCSRPAPDANRVDPPATSNSVTVPPGTTAEPATAAPKPAPAPASAPSHGEKWTGRWTGVEGMYLVVSPAARGYRLDMQWDLDHKGEFDGTDAGGGIAFTRAGVRETLRPTDGDATGLKYLAGKTDCLTVKPGEGYCRD